jgi:hypothetical protein
MFSAEPIVIAAGSTDCEAMNTGVFLQPVNTVSSLAFSVAGVAIVMWANRTVGSERVNRQIFGTLMVATGLGSVAFHGFDGRLWNFFHDITFLSAVWTVAVVNVAELKRWRTPMGWSTVLGGMAVFSVILAIGPGVTNVLTFGVAVTLIASDAVLERSGGINRLVWSAAVASMAVAVLFFLLGRTGGALCDPDSLFQGHGLWHFFAATALTLYFVATSNARTSRPAGSQE